MSNREHLISRLQTYQTFNGAEQRNRLLAISFLQETPNAFLRENYPAHVCAGYLVTNPSRTKVLLNQHLLSGIWMNFGGHADGDENVDRVAKKELHEEGGIAQFLSTGALLDVDVHAVTPHTRQGVEVPWHIHYDFNFLAAVEEDAPFAVSDESVSIRWVTVEEAMKINTVRTSKDEQLQRFYQKLQTPAWLFHAGLIEI